jgi:hypothetical protein
VRRGSVEFVESAAWLRKEKTMKARLSVAVFVLGAVAMAGVGLQAASMTLGGTMSDAKCGAKHAMKDAAACTKACVDKGSDSALVVGDKVYMLSTSSTEAKADLAKLAGKTAKVTGDVAGEKVMVKTVAGAVPKKQARSPPVRLRLRTDQGPEAQAPKTCESASRRGYALAVHFAAALVDVQVAAKRERAGPNRRGIHTRLVDPVRAWRSDTHRSSWLCAMSTVCRSLLTASSYPTSIWHGVVRTIWRIPVALTRAVVRPAHCGGPCDAIALCRSLLNDASVGVNAFRQKCRALARSDIIVMPRIYYLAQYDPARSRGR